jgi:hypothetical protein
MRKKGDIFLTLPRNLLESPLSTNNDKYILTNDKD